MKAADTFTPFANGFELSDFLTLNMKNVGVIKRRWTVISNGGKVSFMFTVICPLFRCGQFTGTFCKYLYWTNFIFVEKKMSG